MIVSALKHFVVVGVVFAFGVGWLLTLVVNVVVGVGLQSVLGVPPTTFYLGSLLLTIVSLALIAIATIFGNRVYRSWAGRGSIGVKALVISTILFAVLVLVRVSPEFGSMAGNVAAHSSYFYNHGWQLIGVFSLPLMRLCLIPLFYFLLGRKVLLAPANGERLSKQSEVANGA